MRREAAGWDRLGRGGSSTARGSRLNRVTNEALSRLTELACSKVAADGSPNKCVSSCAAGSPGDRSRATLEVGAIAKQGAVGQPPKRSRRQPGLNRELILSAAYDEFSERGYARATTRGIAERAGAAEPLLFREFGSKAGLFNEVVFEPMRAFMVEWERSDRASTEMQDRETRAKMFVGGLYDLMRANRGLMLTYFATEVFEPDVLAQPGDIPTFLEVIRLMDTMTERHGPANKRVDRRTKAAAKIRLHERVSVGSVIASALFEDLLFAAMPGRPNRTQIVEELARIAVSSMPVGEA